MKNKIILVTLILATSFVGKAQLYLGAKMGLNFANIATDFSAIPLVKGASTFNTKIGINGGATLKFNFVKTFGIQMDLLYSQMGSISKDVLIATDSANGTLTTTTEKTYDYSYLQIPIFANIAFPIKSERLIPYRYTETVVTIHLYGGGYFGYALSNNTSGSIKNFTVDADGNKSTVVNPIKSAPNKKFNAIDFGLAFGAGISFNISKAGKLTLDGRYLMGMANFNSGKAYVNGVKYPIMKNKAPQIQLGYIHQITKSKRWK